MPSEGLGMRRWHQELQQAGDEGDMFLRTHWRCASHAAVNLTARLG